MPIALHLQKKQTPTIVGWMRIIEGVAQDMKNMRILTEFFLQVYEYYPDEFSTLLGKIARILSPIYSKKYPDKSAHVAHIYLYALGSVCERFGLYDWKNLLDTRAFLITQPQEYARIAEFLKVYEQTASINIQSTIRAIKRIIPKGQYQYTLYGRTKSIPSIAQKCQKKGLQDIRRLGDLFAFRIILEDHNADDCFAVATLLHNACKPLVHRYNDYISIPKINGYQSLHTDLDMSDWVPNLNMPIEVQIRTRSMHQVAEHGIAAHYLYAQTKEAQLPQHSTDTNTLREREANMDNALTLCCLTRDGHAMILPAKSHVQYMAHKIHSYLGKNIHSAMINGKHASADAELKTGDRVEILTQPYFAAAIK